MAILCTNGNLKSKSAQKRADLRLALRPLWSLAGFAETWFLTLLGTRIALQVAAFLQRTAEFSIKFSECAGDTVADALCLSDHAAATRYRRYGKFLLDVLERRKYLLLQLLDWEELSKVFAVHAYLLSACRRNAYARSGGLPSSYGFDVFFSHIIIR